MNTKGRPYSEAELVEKMKQWQHNALHHPLPEGRHRGRDNLRSLIRRNPEIAKRHGIEPISCGPRGEPAIPLTARERKELGLA